MKRVIVFIDGNNFYFGLRKIYGKNRSLKHFDFEGFAKFLADNNKIVGIYYYNALLDKKHNLEKYKSQKEFFENLKKIPSFNLVLCKLLKRNIPGTNKVYYIIKEDDINMAVDIVENACDDNFDTKKIVFSQTPYFSSRARKTIFRVIKNPTRPGIYSRVLDIAVLVSGDGDFVPAVRSVKKKDKLVKNVYFKSSSSRNLKDFCDESLELTKENLNKFFKN